VFSVAAVPYMLPLQAIRKLTSGRTYAQPFQAITILFSE
jgi:hypothetical protein